MSGHPWERQQRARRCGMAVAGALALGLAGTIPVVGAGSIPSKPHSSTSTYIGNPAFGVNFVSAPGSPADDARYGRAQQTGAGWTRWPLYWWQVSPSDCSSFDWSSVDTDIIADIAHGFSVDAILDQTATCAQTGGNPAIPPPRVGGPPPPGSHPASGLTSSTISVPANLSAGVFLDAQGNPTDNPGNWNLAINPNNYWAWFVNNAVNRYKPGGVLAQQQGWGPGQGITVWEMWNEEDYSYFWSGTANDYARLLKVGYLAAKRADLNNQVMFGGLANNIPDATGHYPFLGNVLAVYAADPLAQTYGYFFDILAIHNYSWAWMTWYLISTDSQLLSNPPYSLNKPIWVNESGVPVWDQYPGPTWLDHQYSDNPYRATANEAGSFILQSAALAKMAGAAVIFHFQLNDDCGNQPAGTNFPDNAQLQQQLCAQGKTCAGDAFGLFHNGPTSACFWSDLTPWASRPGLTAYQVMLNTLSGVTPYQDLRPNNGQEERVIFTGPAPGERITVDWARYSQSVTAVITATASSATLIDQFNNQKTIYPVNGFYTLTLPGATNFNTPTCTPIVCDGAAPIGGLPYILIEHGNSTGSTVGDSAVWVMIVRSNLTPRAYVPFLPRR